MARPLLAAFCAVAAAAPGPQEVLIWSDDFNVLNFSNWKHEITMGGGGVGATSTNPLSVGLLC